MSTPQLTPDGRLKHLLAIEGLPAALIHDLLDRADQFVATPGQPAITSDSLAGRTVVNLFFEPSTRTRSAFELAARRLSAQVVNMSVSTSSTSKGETLLDTLKNLEAMAVDMFVVRHSSSGAAAFIAQHCRPGVAVLNAGDGRHAHPTQALLDVATIRRHRPDFSALKVAIVGDLLHSRVARSEIRALHTLGTGEIVAVAPPTLMPPDVASMGVRPTHDLDDGLDNADVVIMLRLQRERMDGAYLPGGAEFHARYGLTAARLRQARPDALVMHPGPINRGVEIDSEVADGPQSVILEQVNLGVAVRMAAMQHIIGGLA